MAVNMHDDHVDDHDHQTDTSPDPAPPTVTDGPSAPQNTTECTSWTNNCADDCEWVCNDDGSDADCSPGDDGYTDACAPSAVICNSAANGGKQGVQKHYCPSTGKCLDVYDREKDCSLCGGYAHNPTGDGNECLVAPEEACGISMDEIILSEECAVATITDIACGKTCSHVSAILVAFKRMLEESGKCNQDDIDAVDALINDVDKTMAYDTVKNPMELALGCNADQDGTFIDVLQTTLNETWHEVRQKLPCTNPSTTTDIPAPTSRGTYTYNYECEDDTENLFEQVVFQLEMDCDNDCAGVCGGTTIVDTCGICDGTNECYPVITVEGATAVTFEADKTGTYVDPGATCAFDGVDIALTKHHNHHTSGNFTEFSESAIDMGRIGSFIVQYRCTYNGETVISQRTVTIKDTMSPWINIVGSNETIVQANKTGTYTDAGATCEDGFDGVISNEVEVSGQVVNLLVPDEYEIKYNCKDTSNHEAVEKKRKVTVKDTLAPVITLHGGSFSCDDSFDYTLTTSTSCSQGDCGECTYTCTDSSQNSASKTGAINCSYDPCAGKQENCICQLCPLDDPNCVETMVVKSCQMVQNTLTCLPGAGNVQDCSTPCPIATCVMPKHGCNRTYPQDKDANGCLIHLCGVDVCPLPPEERLCCRAMTADCLSCNLDISVEEYCRLRPDTVGCPLLGCPQDCSRYFDGCNECRCSDRLARCTKMFCAEPTAFVCHDDQPDELEHNCRTRERWTVEKREWCCVNERVGCCPQVRCRLPPDNCNRTWSREVNERGCLVYPCGIDRCAARPRINPGIILRDDRGVERMRTNANSTFETFENEGLDTARINEDGRVTFRVIDDRGRPRVEMVCRAGENACLNMSTPEDIVRRRNIIKEVVDTLGPVIMSVDESGLSSLRISRADSVVIQPVNDKPVNTTNCADADVDVQTFEEDAYEIVVREKNEQFMACSDNKPLALVTLQNINPSNRSEYSIECWHSNRWEFVELLREGDTFRCPVLPDYTFEIASVAGLTYALTVPPTPQAEPPAPAPPSLTVVYGPGVTKIEACIEDEITIVWNGTHDLRETDTAECDSNETDTSPWHSEFETTGYNKTFIGLGGRYQGETRYYMCSSHCGVNNARLEVTCKYEIDPNRRAMVNVAESNLEIPALIVAGAIIAIIAAALSAVFCKRKPKKPEIISVMVTSKDVNELEKRLLEKPLTWVP